MCGNPKPPTQLVAVGEKPIPVGVYGKGEWFCNLRCLHGGKALHTIDELIDLIRDAFADEPEVMVRVKQWVSRTLESVGPPSPSLPDDEC